MRWLESTVEPLERPLSSSTADSPALSRTRSSWLARLGRAFVAMLFADIRGGGRSVAQMNAACLEIVHEWDKIVVQEAIDKTEKKYREN
jgi:hypothetical protein